MIRSLGAPSLPGILFLLLSTSTSSAQSQTIFFQPPLYPGTGATVTADFNQDGKPDLVNADGTLLLSNGDGTFRTGKSLAVSHANLNAVAVADFNSDGKPDVLLTSSSTTNLYVFLGNGDGTFQPAVTNTGVFVSNFAVADVNGDGRSDVVGGVGATIWVFLGKGDGTFGPGAPFPTSNIPTGLLLLGDFNGDGRVDVALAGQESGNSAGPAGVLLGNGSGGFQPAIISSGVANPQEMVAGDFDSDGKLDLVLTDTKTLKTYILPGNGSGTFQAPAVAVPEVGVLAAADLNGDGKLDLAVGTPPSVNIFLGNGNGSFVGHGNYLYDFFQSVSQPSSIVVADFNGDGKPDLAAQGTMLLGNGDGTFSGDAFVQSSTTRASAGGADSFVGGVSADFNGDGHPDVIAFVQDTVYVLFGDGTGKFSITNTYVFPAAIQSLATADLRNNGALDLVVITNDSSGNWILNVMLGAGDGSFGLPAAFPQGVPGSQTTPSIALAEFSGDHFPDLAAISNGEVQVFLGKGDGTFAVPASYFAGTSPGTLVTADFNNDGKVDVAVASGAGLSILLGKGDGTFNTATFSSLQKVSGLFTAADFNGDGSIDLITSPLQILLGKGDGTFTGQSVFQNKETTGSEVFVGTADFNGDGKLDLFAINNSGFQQSYVWVTLGNGDGTFVQTPFFIGSGNVNLALVADFNHDHRADLAISDGTGILDGHPPFIFSDNAGIATLLNIMEPGFQMSVSALSPSTVTAGSSGTSNVMVMPLFAFSGTVALSCGNNLPAGVTCGFSPTGLSNASGTSTLTVTTPASLAAGTYPVRVTGTSGSLTHTAPLSLVVQALPGFVISTTTLSPATVTAGGSASATITVSPTGGFGANVTFSCSVTLNGSPATIEPPACSFNPSSVASASGPSTLTVTTSSKSGLFVRPKWQGSGWSYAMLLPVLGIVIGAGLIFNQKKSRSLLLVTLMLSGLLLMAGCGGSGHSSGSGGTPSGTYTITVTGSANGAISQKTTLTFTVQ